MLLLFCILLISSAGLVVFINTIVDPLCFFSHTNSFNKRLLAINEREQKTSYLTFHEPHYDSLLIGNSRSTFINQNDFKEQSVFNYSVSGICLDEYDDYVRYAQIRMGNGIKTVYTSISFATVNKNFQQMSSVPPDYYFSKVNSPLYRFKSLFSIDVLRYSYRTLASNFMEKPKSIYYDRNNVAYTIPLDKANWKKHFDLDLLAFLDIYKNNFIYDGEYLRTQFSSILNNNPGTSFVVFTPPVTKQMHCTIKTANLVQEYLDWVRDMVDLFGSVHHFEYIHSITENHVNFLDASHFFPETGTMIASRLQGRTTDMPSDFGMIVNRENVEQSLHFLRKNFDKCD